MPDGYKILRDYVATNLAATVPAPVGRHPIAARSTPALACRLCRAGLLSRLGRRRDRRHVQRPVRSQPHLGDWDRGARPRLPRRVFLHPLSRSTDARGAKRKKAYRPRVLVNPRDANLCPPRPESGSSRHGCGPRGADDPALLDLKTLAYALTGEAYSLEKACKAFGIHYKKRKVKHGEITPDYITYCREDVAATAALYDALAREYERWATGASRRAALTSPATLAKEALREAGVTPLRERLAKPTRSCSVRRWSPTTAAAPRFVCDASRCRSSISTSPACTRPSPPCLACGASWSAPMSRASRRADRSSARWLAGLTPTTLFDPTLWPQLCGFALVKPHGDVLPVRAPYSGDAHGIGINPLHCDEPLICDEPLWYTLADVVAARLLGDTVPEILRVVRLKPSGTADGLRPFSIRGSRRSIPPVEDVFRAMVEERRRLEGRRRRRVDAHRRRAQGGGQLGRLRHRRRAEPPATHRRAGRARRLRPDAASKRVAHSREPRASTSTARWPLSSPERRDSCSVSASRASRRRAARMSSATRTRWRLSQPSRRLRGLPGRSRARRRRSRGSAGAVVGRGRDDSRGALRLSTPMTASSSPARSSNWRR